MKKLACFLLLFLQLYSNSAQSVESYALRIFPLLGKTLSFTITAGMPFADFLFFCNNPFFDKKAERLPDMPEAVKNFIQPLVREHYGSVKLSCKIDSPWSVRYSPNHIFIYASEKEVEHLKNAIINNDTEELALHKHIIRHECAHVIREDSKNEFLLGVITAGISHLAINTLLNIASEKLLPINSLIRGLFWMLVHLGSTVPKQMLWFNYIRPLTKAILSRYQEKKADLFAAEHAQDRIEIVAAMNYYKDRYECGTKIIFELPEEAQALSAINNRFAWRYKLVHRFYEICNFISKESFVTWIEKHPSLLAFLVFPAIKSNLHPTSYERSKYLQKALIAFDEKQSKHIAKK